MEHPLVHVFIRINAAPRVLSITNSSSSSETAGQHRVGGSRKC